MKILAPAKINLFLNITGKRKDGYHEIETIFQAISLYDQLEIEIVKDKKSFPSHRIDLQLVQTKSLQNRSLIESLSGEKNIVWKSAQLFLKKFKLRNSCKISLKKEIPIQAGLGGGSSDAAAVLTAFENIFLKGKSYSTLTKIARQLGADVPFFLQGGCARASGIGEKIVPINPAPEFWAVIFKPSIGLSTKEVYQWLDQDGYHQLTSPTNLITIEQLIKKKRPVAQWSRYIYNRFEKVVFTRVPELKQIKNFLIKSGALQSSLSGSGSAIFGIVSSRSEGERIKKLCDHFNGKAWVVRSVQ